jgi:hypothetical protein
MVTHSSNPPDEVLSELLSEDQLYTVAEMRVRALSWDSAAKAIGWNVHELKRVTRHDPNFRTALEHCKRELDDETDSELQQRLRVQLRSTDADEARKAADQLTKIRIADKRNQTRLEIKRLDCETKLKLAELRSQPKQKNVPSEPQDEVELDRDGYPVPVLTPEQIAHGEAVSKRYTLIYAEQAAREDATVYFWSGCHKLGETLPDESDVPLRIMADHTLNPTRYWAVPWACPLEDAMNGPFLPPPGMRPNVCPTISDLNAKASSS